MSIKINVPKLTQRRMRELLCYDPKTGIFTWIGKASRNTVIGSRAGCDDLKNHRRINIDYEPIFEHRLAWFWIHGVWPSAELDHINLDGMDNRIANLREATSQQNKFNLIRRATKKTSKYKGVFPYHGGPRWRALIRQNGKTRFLGSFVTEEEAARAYDAAAIENFGAYCNLNFKTDKAEAA
jgi:hypothetical protein